MGGLTRPQSALTSLIRAGYHSRKSRDKMNCDGFDRRNHFESGPLLSYETTL
jgi:hypothetical protein